MTRRHRRPIRRPELAPPLDKRILDVAVATAVLVATAPLLIVVGAVIRATSAGPVLFRQARIGLAGQPFELLKFRTMVAGGDPLASQELIRAELRDDAVADASGSFKTGDSARVTAIGRWLRRTSLDELPQLVNVLRGEMSVVGPRPALDWEVAMFPAEYRTRADVLPGLTGLWQVSGRSLLSTLDMLRLDVEYVRTRSPSLDLSILVRTIPVLLRSDGAR